MAPAAARPLDARQLGACAFFVFAPIGVQMPFFPLWLAGSGFSANEIALLLGIAPLVRFVANLTIPPLADRKGDAVIVLFACAILTAIAQGLSGLAFGISWIFVLSLIATAGQGPMVPLLDSIVLREARRRAVARETPLDYGRVRGVGSISVLLLMLAGGAVAAVTPTAAIIWMIAGASLVAVIAIRVLLPRETAAAGDGGLSVPRAPLANRGLILAVIVASSAIQASHGMIYAFGSIGWRANGYGDSAIGLFWASGVATEVGLFVFANRLARGRSLSYPFLVAGSLTAVVRWSVMAADPGPGWLLFAQLLPCRQFCCHLSRCGCRHLASRGRGAARAGARLGLRRKRSDHRRRDDHQRPALVGPRRPGLSLRGGTGRRWAGGGSLRVARECRRASRSRVSTRSRRKRANSVAHVLSAKV